VKSSNYTWLLGLRFVLRSLNERIKGRHLLLFNRALLGKWLWHYVPERPCGG